MEFLTWLLSAVLAFTPSYGGQGISQLDQWKATGGNVQLASSTAGLKINLLSKDCLGTNGSGVLQEGTCTGGGGGTQLGTTSWDYWKTQRNFFSTTSADYWESTQAARGTGFSTTSADAWKAQRNFFSTTSADYYASLFDEWAVQNNNLVPTTTRGIIVSASSTIGNGTLGLTNSGNATTTGRLYVGPADISMATNGPLSAGSGFGNLTMACTGCGGSGGEFLGIANFGGGAVGINTFTARGTASSPSATQSGDVLYFMGGRGFGTTLWNAGSKALIQYVASQAHTDANNGTYITLETTPNNSTTRAERIRIDQTGFVGIGSTTPGTLLSVNGIANLHSATSTFYSTGGINLAAGCFAVAGTCLPNAAALTAYVPYTGATADVQIGQGFSFRMGDIGFESGGNGSNTFRFDNQNLSGTWALDLTKLGSNTRTVQPPNWDGELVVSTSTTQVSTINATSSAATSTIAGGLTVGASFKLPITNCTEALETNAAGYVICGTDATGGAGGTSDFTWSTTYNALHAATTSNLWARGIFSASSTVYLNKYKVTNHANNYLDFQNKAAGDPFSLMRVVAPSAASDEATLSLVVDKDDNDDGTNEEFVDLYTENYADSVQSGFRQGYSGTGVAKPILFGHWATALGGAGKNIGNKLILMPSGTVGIAQATSTLNLSSMLHIASSTATTLLRVDAAPGSNKFTVAGSGAVSVAAGNFDVTGNIIANAGNSFIPKNGSNNAELYIFNNGASGLNELTISDFTGTLPVSISGRLTISNGFLSQASSTVLGVFNIASTSGGVAYKTAVPAYMTKTFSYASSTQGQGTTTRSIGVAPQALTVKNVQCDFSNFMRVLLYDGTNRANDFVASSTVGTVTFTTNNSFTAGEPIRIDIGTTTNIAANLYGSCTLKYVYD